MMHLNRAFYRVCLWYKASTAWDQICIGIYFSSSTVDSSQVTRQLRLNNAPIIWWNASHHRGYGHVMFEGLTYSPLENMQWLISWALSCRIAGRRMPKISIHYSDVIMATIASQITSLTIVYSTDYSDADQREHQSSASLAFVWEFTGDRWIPRTKGQ